MNEPRYNSVWDALEDTPEAAENMKLRATLLLALQDQVEAAQRLGITQRVRLFFYDVSNLGFPASCQVR